MAGCLRLRPKARGGSSGASDRSGGGGRRFYRQLVRKADERFDRHRKNRPADERVKR